MRIHRPVFAENRGRTPSVAPWDSRLACWGDSLTYGTGSVNLGNLAYPDQLKALAGMGTRDAYNGGVGGNTSAQIATRITANPIYWPRVTIIWAGRNDGGVISNAQVVINIQGMVNTIGHPRYLVLSVLNGSGEGIGTSAYTTYMDMNAQISAAFPNNYLDVRAALVAAYNSGIPQDVTDHTNDIPPSSLRYDNIHLLNTGYAVVASHVETYIRTTKGW